MSGKRNKLWHCGQWLERLVFFFSPGQDWVWSLPWCCCCVGHKSLVQLIIVGCAHLQPTIKLKWSSKVLFHSFASMSCPLWCSIHNALSSTVNPPLLLFLLPPTCTCRVQLMWDGLHLWDSWTSSVLNNLKLPIFFSKSLIFPKLLIWIFSTFILVQFYFGKSVQEPPSVWIVW